MKDATKRLIVRWLHIALAIPIVGYIYSPFELLPSYAVQTRFVFLPAMVLSGLWMWKGHVLRRLVKRAA
jgi:thiosulfate reductase cytochrome b subunit